jgi:hypothetical protein
LVLPPEQVDLLIDAGRDALKSNIAFRAFLGSLGGAPARGTPVAAPADGPQEALAR